MTAIPSNYRNQVSMGLPAEVKPEDITLVGGLNFEKGKIALKTENYTENDAVKALLKKQMESLDVYKRQSQKRYSCRALSA